MELLTSPFLSTTAELWPSLSRTPKPKPKPPVFICSWSLSDGSSKLEKPRNLNIVRRRPEQMVRYLEDDRNSRLYGRHVLAAIKAMRSTAGRKVDVRSVMASFIGKLTFKEMCFVLKEQKGWSQVRDFFAWMKLQFSYRPSVVAYTIVLSMYGQKGKIKLAEDTFLEMLEVGCEPDEVACGTMLCMYARWARHEAMLSFYSAVQDRGISLSLHVYNFMLSSLQKKSFHTKVVDLWGDMQHNGVAPNHFTYTVAIASLVKGGFHEEAFRAFDSMRELGFLPEEVTYSLLISSRVRDGDCDEAVQLYEDMRGKGIVPSHYTCASLLTLYYKKGDYSKALSLFSEMERNKICADEVIYGLLIRVYGKLGLYQDAERTFEEVQGLGMLSDEKTYIAMAQVRISSGNVEKALDLLHIMESRNICLSRFGYFVMLRCYVVKRDLGKAEAAFQVLSKSGPLDAVACNDMLSLYVRLNLMEKAKDLADKMMRNQLRVVVFNEALYKRVLGKRSLRNVQTS